MAEIKFMDSIAVASIDKVDTYAKSSISNINSYTFPLASVDIVIEYTFNSQTTQETAGQNWVPSGDAENWVNGADAVDGTFWGQPEDTNDVVKGFKQDENGFVKYLTTKSGRKIKGDMFVDCTGFARVLIDKVEENKWVSYKDNLLVDSALNFNYKREEGEPIKNYTHAWAQKNGWCWEIPTQTRMGCGYVFSSQYTNFDKAHDEISKAVKKRYGKKIDVQRQIKFNTGRYEKFWVKNVLSSGLSSAFIEPLEATSIHATIMQVNHFIENYYKEDMPFKINELQDQYNGEMTMMWDNIRDFIIYHYITPRKDSKFWIDSNKEKRRSPKLKRLMKMWKHRMPRKVDYINDKHNNFYSIGNVLWYQIAIGMKLLNPKIAKRELKDYGIYQNSAEQYKLITSEIEKHLEAFTTTDEYYKTL